MSKYRVSIISSIIFAFGGITSILSTGWPLDIIFAIWNGDQIDSTASFFAISNISGAMAVILLFYLYYIVLPRKVNLFIYILIFLGLNCTSIIYLIKFSSEFANIFGQSLAVSLISLIFACSGGSLLSFGILRLVSILVNKRHHSRQ